MGEYDQVFVRPILGLESHHLPFPVKLLHRNLFSISQEGYDHRAIRRALVLLDDQEVPSSILALNAEQVKEVPTHLGEGSESEVIEGVGHFMLVEKPEEINSRILQFLST